MPVTKQNRIVGQVQIGVKQEDVEDILNTFMSDRTRMSWAPGFFTSKYEVFDNDKFIEGKQILVVAVLTDEMGREAVKPTIKIEDAEILEQFAAELADFRVKLTEVTLYSLTMEKLLRGLGQLIQEWGHFDFHNDVDGNSVEAIIQWAIFDREPIFG